MPIDELIKDSTSMAVGAVQGASEPVVEDFGKVVVDDHNKTNEDYALGLPIVNTIEEINDADAQKVDEAKVIAYITKANKELRNAQKFLGDKELQEFEPFYSIDDIKTRAGDYEKLIKKATTAKDKKDQNDVLSKVNNYVAELNKEGGINLAPFKSYEEATKAIATGKDGKSLLETEFTKLLSDKNTKEGLAKGILNPFLSDIPETRHNIEVQNRAKRAMEQEEATMRRTEKIRKLESLTQPNSSEPFLETIYTPYLEKSSVHNTREEADARVVQLISENPKFAGAGVKQLHDGTWEVFIPPSFDDASYNKEASQITAQGAEKSMAKANELAPVYNALKAQVKKYEMQGIPVPPHTLEQYNKVTDDIQNYLETADVLSGTAEKQYAEYYKKDKERGNVGGGLLTEIFSAITDILASVPTALISGAPYAMGGYGKEEAQKAIEEINKFTDYAKESFGEDVGVSPIYNENREGLQKAANSVMGIIPYAGLGELAFPAMIATGYVSSRRNLEGVKELDDNEKDLVALIQGVVQGTIMHTGLKIGKGQMKINDITGRVIDKLPSQFSRNTLTDIVGKEVTQLTSNVVATGVGFSGLNAGSVIANEGISKIVDAIKGKKVMPETTHDVIGEIVNEVKGGFGTGALLGLAMGSIKLGVDKINNERDFRNMDKLVQDPTLVSIARVRLGQSLVKKEIALPEFKQRSKNIKDMADVAIQIPKDYSNRTRYEIFKLLRDNARLESQKGGLAEPFVIRIDKQIAENNDALTKIADAEDGKKVKSDNTQETKAEVGSEEVVKDISATDTPSTETATKASNPTVQEDGVGDIELYHAGNIEGISDNSLINELGIHLGSKETADKISEAKGVAIKQYKVDVKNPIKVPDFPRWEAFVVSRKLKDMGILTENEFEKIRKETGNDKEKLLLRLLKGKGYDGFVYENAFEGGGKSYVAFDKSQIKAVEQSLSQPSKQEGKSLDESKALAKKDTSLADKVRSLKSKKGTLQTDLTIGLKDLALEEIAQLIEDGVEVAKAIGKVLSDIKYKSLDKDEITKLVFSANTLTENDFKRRDSEKAIDRTNRVMADLKARGYTQNEIDYILKGGFDRIAKVDDLREVKAVVSQLNKIMATMPNKPKAEAVKIAIDQLKWESGKEIILENAIRKFKQQHGIEVKTPTDRAVKPKPTKITVDEKKALVQQIKIIAKNTKEVMNNFKEVSKAIHEILKTHKTTISTKQLDAIQRRMGTLKVGSDTAIEKYVNYVEKVLADAEYADQIKSAKKYSKGIKKALKNTDIPLLVRDMAEAFLTIDAYEVADAYKHNDIAKQIYDAMKTSGMRVIDGQVKDLTRKAVKLTDINAYIQKELEAKKKLEEFANIENEKETKVDSPEIKNAIQKKYNRLSDMVKAMLANGRSPLDGEEYSFTEKERIQLDKVANMKLDYFETPKEQQLVNEALEHVLLNGDMGLIPHILTNYKNNVDVKRGINAREEATKGKISLLPISKFFAKIQALLSSDKSSHDDLTMQKLISGRYSMRIDDLVKNFKDNSIFGTGMELVAKGYANYKTSMRRMDAGRIEKRLFTANKFDLKKQLESKFRITMFLRQLEFESNPHDDTQVPAIDYMMESIKAAVEKEHPVQDDALAILERVVAENVEGGQVSLAKLDANMSSAEKEAVRSLQKIYSDLRTYHDEVAVEIRNKPYHGKTNYAHINAYPKKKSEILSATEMRDKYKLLLGGTESGTLESRSGGASPINLDPFSTANTAIRDVMLDYFMTNPLRVMDKINDGFLKSSVREVGKYPYESDAYKNAILRRDLASAMRDTFDKLKSHLLERAYYESTPVGDFMQLMSRRTTQYLLARFDKLIAELGSNIGYVAMTNPEALALGTTKYHELVHDDVKLGAILENVLSHSSERILPHGGIGTSAMDTNDFDIITSSTQNIPSKAKRVALKAYYNTLARPIKSGQSIGEGMAMQGDLLVIRRLWAGAMAIEFKKLTGETIDFDKIALKDVSYFDKYENEINKATSNADRIVTDAGASKNMFVTAPTLVGKNANLGHIVNYYLRGFSMNEFEVAGNGITHAFKGGKITQEQALGQLEGVALRAGIYKSVQVALSTAVISGLAGIYSYFTDDDKTDKGELEALLNKSGLSQQEIAKLQVEIAGKENYLKGSKDALMTGDDDWLKIAEKIAKDPATFTENFRKGIAQQAVTMALTRNFGNVLSGYVIAPLFEEANKAVMGDSYDPYRDNLMYSRLPDASKKDWQNKAVEQFLGPFGLSVGASINAFQTYNDKKELQDRIKGYESELATESISEEEKEKVTKKLDKANRELVKIKTKMIIDMITTIAFMTGSVPSLKNFRDAYEKSINPKYRLPSDWERIEDNYEYLRKGGLPQYATPPKQK